MSKKRVKMTTGWDVVRYVVSLGVCILAGLAFLDFRASIMVFMGFLFIEMPIMERRRDAIHEQFYQEYPHLRPSPEDHRKYLRSLGYDDDER